MRRSITLAVLGLTGLWGLHAQVISTYPYSQGFENFTTCSTSAGAACTLSEGWVNATGDDIDWTTDIGGTPSASTGPSVDHTLGNGLGKYLYLESSVPGSPTKTANLLSPYFNFTNVVTPQLSFWYHMFGATQGTMHVDIDTTGTGNWILDVVPSWTDNIDLWQQRVVDLTAFGGKDSVRIRVRGITGSSFTSDMAVDDFLVENLVNNNLGVTAFVDPQPPFGPGAQPVSVVISNPGSNAVTSAMINWTVNGVAQTAVPFAGTLAPGASSAALPLGSAIFPPGPSTIKAWTSMPNGVPDGDPGNDSLETIVCTALAGTIPVGPTGILPDLSTAVAALYTCGVGGPVTFAIQPGTYSEPILLVGQVPGASSTNTITFDGGSAATTTVTFNGTLGFGTVSLDGVSWVTVKNMTINSTAAADAWGVKVINGATFCTVDNCVINVTPGLTFDAEGVSISNSYTSEFTEGQAGWFITVSNNIITGGDKGIHAEGQDANRTPGMKFLNNTISNVQEAGIYVDDQDSIEIIGNNVSGILTTTGDGIYCFDLVDYKINGNTVFAPDHGIYVFDGNFDGPATLGASQIINNMVRTNTNHGIYLDDVNDTDLYHNTSYGEPAIRLNDLINVNVRNNIFVSNIDFAFEYDDAGPIASLNYNLYHTPAGNANFAKWGATTYADLLAWQTADPTLNGNSLEGDPVFKDNQTDLHVSGTLPNDAGDNSVGITVDIDGDTRPLAPSTTVDMGADEYTPLTEDLKIVSIDSVSSDCGLGAAQQVAITVTNIGVNAVTGAQAGFSVNGGAFTAAETIPGTIASGATVAYVFTATADLSTPGNYTITAYATSVTPADQDNSNDTISRVVISIPTISTFPYKQDFENGQGGWSSGGTGSSWAFGTPAKSTINSAGSGLNSWTTGGLGAATYNADEQSWVLGPCFDMTSAPAAPWVAMKIWWESEFSWDGANLQTSTDDGTTWTNVGNLGDPNNWYTDNTINGAPGGSQIGWTGRSESANGSGGWVTAAHPLDASLVGVPKVLFRIAFGADGSVQDDGFAFDDFAIGELPAVSLGPDTTFCIGTSLDAGNWGGTYLWSTGDTTQSILLTNNTGVAINDSVIWVSVVDSLGLRGSDTIMVDIPATLPVVTAMQTQEVDCNGNATGQAMAMTTGGSGTISYLWNTTPAQTTAAAIGLAAGDYTVTVVDSFGCVASDTVTITEPTALGVALDSINNALCFGDANGAIAITTSGGTAPYSYAWSNGDTTEDVSNLAAGSYTGTITDANGCVLVSPALSVSQPDSLSLALDAAADASCPNAADGSVSITVNGGTMPYSYAWDNGATTEDLTGLAPGNYIGTITDANGCILVSDAVRIGFADTLTTADFSFAFVDNATVSFSNGSSANATSYAWDFGDGTGTSTDVSPSYTYTANGSVTVTLIATGPCGSDTTTQVIELTAVGVDLGLARLIQVYPNPSNGLFTVSFSEISAQNVSVSVFNVHGQEVLRQSPDQTVGSFKANLDLNDQPNGSYLLKVEVDGKLYLKQLLKY